MRKTMMTMGLGLALTLGGAGMAAAQAAPDASAQRAPRAERQDRQGGERMERRGERHGERGPRAEARRAQRGDRWPGPLLRGIELTADQQAKVKALHAQRTEQARGARGARPDSAARPTAEQRRQRMEQRRAAGAAARERHVAQLREILTPEQRVQLDANVKAMQERAKTRPQARRGR